MDSSRFRIPDCGFTWVNAYSRRPEIKTTSDPLLDYQVRYYDFENTALCRVITPKEADETRITWSYYDPSSVDPALFRNFADMPTTEDAILAFATRYGLVFRTPLAWSQAFYDGVKDVRRPKEQLMPDEPRIPVEARVSGMQYGHWAYEIKAMRDAVQLWDALAQKRLDLVSDIIAYSPDGQRAFVRSSMEWDREIAVTKDMRGRGVAIVGLMLLQAIANRRLAYRVGTHVLLDADRRKLSLDISPTDIRGLMWLQFARAFTSNRRYRQCAQCGKWFELAPNEPVSKELSHRVSAKHCSGACRSKAHREKQKKAQSLAQEGNPVSKIAELLDSDESTVAGWIRKGKGES